MRQESANAELREQFVALLGHDLRNPLASISAGARLMLKAKTPEDAVRLEAMMQSSVGRMAKMIESVMDLARGRLGDFRRRSLRWSRCSTKWARSSRLPILSAALKPFRT